VKWKRDDLEPEGSLENRRHGRLPCESLWCNLGRVKNLSAGGLRVRCRLGQSFKMNQRVIVRFQSSEGMLTIEGRVAWRAQAGILRQEIGVELILSRPDVKSAYGRLAAEHRTRRTIGDAA
jgi:hypothetical protein